nr:MAG TPA: hypothetical protein [Caudoviricetes sp.]
MTPRSFSGCCPPTAHSLPLSGLLGLFPSPCEVSIPRYARFVKYYFLYFP